ncbi:MAG: hypothetical protein SFX18_00495 [Pirellulales bacterium]|nr:hypothetical protein [Pirellulales bacterium]
MPVKVDPLCETECQLTKIVAEKAALRQQTQRTLRKARRCIVALAAIADPAKITPEIDKMVKHELLAIDNEFRSRVQSKAQDEERRGKMQQ